MSVARRKELFGFFPSLVILAVLVRHSHAASGDLDLSFGPTLNDVVYSVAVQSDDKVIIGGNFTTVNGASRSRIARLNADGTLDATFQNALAGANALVRNVALQTNGQVLMGGDFTSVNGSGRNHIARLNSNGSLDTNFVGSLVGTNSTFTNVNARFIAVQSDGKLLVGGDFATVNGTSRTNLARLNSNGTLDTNFLNGLNGPNDSIRTMIVQTDGRVIIGGFFTNVNGIARGLVARLNTNGTLDTTFLNGPAGTNGFHGGTPVNSLALQSDGQVLVGGSFTRINGAARTNIARLSSDGTLDTNFLAGANGAANAVALQDNGQGLIGGAFTLVNGTTRSRIARFNDDGSLDTNFLSGLAGADGLVRFMTVQSDGNVLITGDFTNVNGVARGLGTTTRSARIRGWVMQRPEKCIGIPSRTEPGPQCGTRSQTACGGKMTMS